MHSAIQSFSETALIIPHATAGIFENKAQNRLVGYATVSRDQANFSRRIWWTKQTDAMALRRRAHRQNRQSRPRLVQVRNLRGERSIMVSKSVKRNVFCLLTGLSSMHILQAIGRFSQIISVTHCYSICTWQVNAAPTLIAHKDLSICCLIQHMTCESVSDELGNVKSVLRISL